MERSARNRKTLLADAATDIIGTEGLRGLTHRATDARAGLPPGTCSYHYPARSDLLAAVLHRISELERADIDRYRPGPLTPDLDPDLLVEGTTTTLAHWLGPARIRSRASMILRLDPGSRELIESAMGSVIAEFHAMASALTGDPHRARLAITLVGGILFDELTRGPEQVDIDQLRAQVATVVRVALPDRESSPRRG
ncbi:TetR/AcrR family transcriptional regulator [Nocardia sp. CC227C]|uniref:TetR/AcrR family transcriptional regulator n=1 Tax=Nocardia sp. CC227C TaxID=3044562 RepID=UPI00278C5B78|nr:hypothetical protein [Nocardia sp. CC227C]